jgi:capsular exopolysaccharide synthesis family protein
MGRHFEVLRATEAPGGSGLPERTDGPGESVELRARHRNDADQQIAKLAQRIFVLPGSAKAPGAVAFCGVQQGVGCTWICGRCGEWLAAQVQGSVCVIDANLRSPALHSHFQVQTEDGLTEALADSRPATSFAKRVGKSNLWLVTSGATKGEPNGTPNTARLRSRFSELRAQFDYFLVDTPPVACFADALVLAQMADGVVLVIDSNATRRETARIAKQSFDAARVPVLGVVLNRRTYPIPEALYRRI